MGLGALSGKLVIDQMQNPMALPTPKLQDIAQATGYAVSTVSYAMRGGLGKISPDVCREIQAAAEALGYRPNGAAALLARQRRKSATKSNLSVGLLQPLESAEQRRYRNAASKGFLAACEANGLHFQELRVSRGMSLRSVLRGAWHQGIEGLCLHDFDTICQPESIQSVDWSPFSVVQSYRHNSRPFFDTVTHVAFDFMFETLEQVYALGYRKIAVILAKTVSRIDDYARLGALRAFAEVKGLSPLALWQCKAGRWVDSREEGEVVRWLRGMAVDAVVAFPFRWYYVLVDEGFKIPEQLGFATPMSYPGLENTPDISGCDAREGEIGWLLCERLLQLIALGRRGMPERPLQDLIAPRWLPGETLLAQPRG